MATERKERRKGTGWLRRLTSEGPADRAELVELIRAAARGGIVDADALLMIQGVLRVGDQHVRDIMVPRSQMVVLERDSGPQQLLPAVIESGHSRFPVIGDDRDQIAGILLAKDLLRYFAEGAQGSWDVRDVLRPASFVPESKRLNVLLKEFRASRNHMAIVVDEYGGVAGLVTIEDVLEQIVGEIEDEYDFDEVEDNILREKSGRWRVKAQTDLSDFNQVFKTDFADEEHTTVGGLVISRFGRLPKRGESVTIDGLKFQVLRADSRRLYTLLVERLKEPAA
jgi:magnesium and cobalt transporter